MDIKEGSYIFVRYDIPGPICWHERYVLRVIPIKNKASGSIVEIVTPGPDHQHYIEDIGWTSPDTAGVRPLSSLNRPNGVPDAQAHRFNRRLTAAQITRFRRASEETLEEFLLDNPALELEVGPVELPLAAAVKSVEPLSASEGWLVLHDTTGLTSGKILKEISFSSGVESGNLAIVVGEDGVRRVLERVPLAEASIRLAALKSEFLRLSEGVSRAGGGDGEAGAAAGPSVTDDARILPVELTASGDRYRSIRSVAEHSRQQEFSDWPLTGPRIAKIYISELAKVGIDPSRRHITWSHENALKADQKLKHLHEVLTDILELLLLRDQIDGPNLIGVEALVRYLCHIEREILRVTEAKAPAGSGLGTTHYLGRTVRAGGAIVIQELEEYVAKQSAQEADILKQNRKAEEEKRLAQKDARNDKK